MNQSGLSINARLAFFEVKEDWNTEVPPFEALAYIAALFGGLSPIIAGLVFMDHPVYAKYVNGLTMVIAIPSAFVVSFFLAGLAVKLEQRSRTNQLDEKE